ncbi:MAG: hypothetical protein EXR75_13365 [Myxococcales bacterium]|nr:hypothetical protein [Myxococcales bacterium]
MLVLAALTAPGVAFAGDDALAEKLFHEGRTLLEAGALDPGALDEACARFTKSHAAAESIGALVNLALCRAKQEKFASAWRGYLEAAVLAQTKGDQDRASGATAEAKALEPRLSRLTVIVSAPIDGLVVKRDGEAIPPAEIGQAVAIDRGRHALEATAPGRAPWSGSVEIAPEHDSKTVTVPALAELGDAGGDTPLDWHWISGWLVGGVGVLTLGFGSGAGIYAIQEDDALRSDPLGCPDLNANRCQSPAATERKQELEKVAIISTIGIGLGAAAIVTGAVLLVTAPPAEPAKSGWLIVPVVTDSAAGVSLSAAF